MKNAIVPLALAVNWMVGWVNAAQSAEGVEYRLHAAVSPTNGGLLSVTPAGREGWYAAGTTVTLTVNPTNNFRLLAWRGDVAGTSAVQRVVMQADCSVTAILVPKSRAGVPAAPKGLRITSDH